MEALAVRKGIPPRGYFTSFDYPYPNLATCLADRGKVLSYALKKGVNAKGVLCGKEWRGYQPVVIWSSVDAK